MQWPGPKIAQESRRKSLTGLPSAITANGFSPSQQPPESPRPARRPSHQGRCRTGRYTSSVIDALACPSIRWTAFTLAPAEIAKLAAVCRRSCGVMVGKLLSAFRQAATAGANTRGRQLELRSTPPRRSVNTSASRSLPTIRAASSSASAAENGTERRS
jgi:hypothetical protein